MKVLGVDPGLRTSGYAVLELRARQVCVLDAGVFRVDPELPLPRRLLQLHQDLTEILREYHPDFLAIEELYAHYKHPRTAILMGHARGALLLAAAQQHVPVLGFAATRVKKSLTGSGHAAKEQMQRAIATQLKLNAIPQPADVADALAIALCCLNEKQREILCS